MLRQQQEDLVIGLLRRLVEAAETIAAEMSVQPSYVSGRPDRVEEASARTESVGA